MKIIESYNDDISSELIEVKSADYAGGHTILVTFSDSKEKLIDFMPFLSRSLHPSITKYLDEKLFQQFEIKDGNLNWNDYDLIFPIHNLHDGKID